MSMKTIAVMTLIAISLVWGLATMSEKDVINEVEAIDNINKEGIVETTLMTYNYVVEDVIIDSNDLLGSYASVTMISEGETNKDICEQVGAGLGTLYGVWDDKDYYFVNLVDNTLHDRPLVCTYMIDGITLTSYMNDLITISDMVKHLERECILA